MGNSFVNIVPKFDFLATRLTLRRFRDRIAAKLTTHRRAKGGETTGKFHIQTCQMV
jgi:hypothetical protein